MKIAVICANGKVGKLLVKEAAARGIDVTAVVRGKSVSSLSCYQKRPVSPDPFRSGGLRRGH